ncbi:MAG: DUF4954 family protein [Sphaerochaetaceae bacterium]|nr:DUF4954 family protein [Spirochaetales bacterium]MDY5500422.1 DUF4954 family protein [Sphaerochaetaceae bacterium]
MNRIAPLAAFGYGFIEPPFLPEGRNEWYLRNEQNPGSWRHLTMQEIGILESEGNRCQRWDDVLVTDPFDPSCIRFCSFYGLVRLGALQPETLRFHDFEAPEGLYNSRIISCDIGDHVSISDCSYISHYLIGNRVILHENGEIQCTNHAKFGTGIVKEGEDESVRVTIAVMNEAEGRAVIPFRDMTIGDAWLCAKHREDKPLMEALAGLTEKTMSHKRGYYGTIGDDSVIKGTRIIKDVETGPACYIKGANKLKNLHISSSEEEPTQLGEGIELVNGIIGYGCRVFYGVKAVRFILEDHVSLKYGARVLNSIIGDNSTISCCEVLSNLVFPAHEQHHNNSFLIATCIKGQSNMAAGANIGSNHNSRGADGELVAGRGFWPALSSTLKHNCSFASFTLITKGNYPYELHNPIPFALISGDRGNGRVVMPAYWWLYNLYALERNSWKFLARDKRRHPRQIYETDYLAPDTVHEILAAMRLLEQWTEEAWAKRHKERASGAWLLEKGRLGDLVVEAKQFENSAFPVEVVKASEGYRAYKDMLSYYGEKSLLGYLSASGESLSSFDMRTEEKMLPWENVGGQLIRKDHMDALRRDILSGKVDSWEGVHQAYREIATHYEEEKAVLGIQVLRLLSGHEHLTEKDWAKCLQHLADVRSYIEMQVYLTKEKDYQNPFRMTTYENEAERDAVLGKVDDNPFIQQSKATTQSLLALTKRVRF